MTDLARAGRLYLASPYTATKDREQAFRDACYLAARLTAGGIPVFAAVPWGHVLVLHGYLPQDDHAFWMEALRPWMDACDALVVATIDGWEKSRGIAEEIRIFRDAGKPIYRMNRILQCERMEGH